MTKPVGDNPSNPEKAGAIPVFMLVDSFGAPITLAGSISEVDPPGPYSRMVDESMDGKVIYVGDAVPGTSPSSPAWRVSKLELRDAPLDLSVLYASGTPRFVHSWEDRLTLQYS